MKSEKKQLMTFTPVRYCLYYKNINHIYADLVTLNAHNMPLMRIMQVVMSLCQQSTE